MSLCSWEKPFSAPAYATPCPVLIIGCMIVVGIGLPGIKGVLSNVFLSNASYRFQKKQSQIQACERSYVLELIRKSMLCWVVTIFLIYIIVGQCNYRPKGRLPARWKGKYRKLCTLLPCPGKYAIPLHVTLLHPFPFESHNKPERQEFSPISF
jgi:hypothetical protein